MNISTFKTNTPTFKSTIQNDITKSNKDVLSTQPNRQIQDKKQLNDINLRNFEYVRNGGTLLFLGLVAEEAIRNKQNLNKSFAKIVEKTPEVLSENIEKNKKLLKETIGNVCKAIMGYFILDGMCLREKVKQLEKKNDDVE